MFNKDNRTALFVDGANIYATARTLGFNLDYDKLRKQFPNVLRPFYFTAMREEHLSTLGGLVDFLEYNGWTVIKKNTKEYHDTATGKTKIKGNMDIDLTVQMMRIAPHVDRIVLCSGDGDFVPLVKEVQNMGCHVTVISTMTTRPPMIADELRRAADRFIDIMEIRDKVEMGPHASPKSTAA